MAALAVESGVICLERACDAASATPSREGEAAHKKKNETKRNERRRMREEDETILLEAEDIGNTVTRRQHGHAKASQCR
jgi:hypothetical protein